VINIFATKKMVRRKIERRRINEPGYVAKPNARPDADARGAQEKH
jgi:hypothetical protein